MSAGQVAGLARWHTVSEVGLAQAHPEEVAVTGERRAAAVSQHAGRDEALELSELALPSGVVRVGRRAGSGTPLLLLNGIGAGLETWDTLLHHLPGRAVVSLDLPGTGGSQALQGPRRMGGYAQIVTELLDAIEVSQVDVLGYSWGGALAQELARRERGRVRSLVLCATTPGLGGQPPGPWVVWAMMSPLRYHSRTYLRLVAPIIYGTRIRDGGVGVARLRAQPPSTIGYLHQLWAISGWTSRPWLRELQLPTLVVSGRGDQLAPVRNGVILAREIPRARLEVVGGGHLILVQEVEASARAITAFLDAVEASGAEPPGSGGAGRSNRSY